MEYTPVSGGARARITRSQRDEFSELRRKSQPDTTQQHRKRRFHARFDNGQSRAFESAGIVRASRAACADAIASDSFVAQPARTMPSARLNIMLVGGAYFIVAWYSAVRWLAGPGTT